MGIDRSFELDAGWERAAELLDRIFPLAEGSHRTAADYVVHLQHLLVIGTDGACTGLARPGQFVEAGGHREAPSSILLEHEGLQVEIEPGVRRGAARGARREHRLQLLAALAAA